MVFREAHHIGLACLVLDEGDAGRAAAEAYAVVNEVAVFVLFAGEEGEGFGRGVEGVDYDSAVAAVAPCGEDCLAFVLIAAEGVGLVGVAGAAEHGVACEDLVGNLLACGVEDVDTAVAAVAHYGVAERGLGRVGDGNHAAARCCGVGVGAYLAGFGDGLRYYLYFPGVAYLGVEVALVDGHGVAGGLNGTCRYDDGFAAVAGREDDVGLGSGAGDVEGDGVGVVAVLALNVVGVFTTGLVLLYALGGEAHELVAAEEVEHHRGHPKSCPFRRR